MNLSDKCEEHNVKDTQKNRAKAYWYLLGQRRCHCGRQLVWAGEGKNRATLDHLVPKSKGGTWHLKNILIVCQECNSKRGNKDFSGWVTGNRFPKHEWLVNKHKEAKKLYEDSYR